MRNSGERSRPRKTSGIWPLSCITGGMFWRFSPPVRQGDDAYYHPLYVEAVKRLPYIEYWLDDFIEKGGKEHWMKSPLTHGMTI